MIFEEERFVGSSSLICGEQGNAERCGVWCYLPIGANSDLHQFVEFGVEVGQGGLKDS